MNARAVTVTLNPAIDQTVRLASLRPGHVHRARSSRDDAGGKGINVAACLADWGVPTAALGVLGGGNDGVFGALFSTRGIVDGCLRIPGSTRTNIKLVDEDNGETTDINRSGRSVAQAWRLAAAGPSGGAVRQPAVWTAVRCMGATAGAGRRRRCARAAGHQWRRTCGCIE